MRCCKKTSHRPIVATDLHTAKGSSPPSSRASALWRLVRAIHGCKFRRGVRFRVQRRVGGQCPARRSIVGLVGLSFFVCSWHRPSNRLSRLLGRCFLMAAVSNKSPARNNAGNYIPPADIQNNHNNSRRRRTAMQALFVAWCNFARSKNAEESDASDCARGEWPRMDAQRTNR